MTSYEFYPALMLQAHFTQPNQPPNPAQVSVASTTLRPIQPPVRMLRSDRGGRDPLRGSSHLV